MGVWPVDTGSGNMYNATIFTCLYQGNSRSQYKMYIIHVQSDFWYNHEKFCNLFPLFVMCVHT